MLDIKRVLGSAFAPARGETLPLSTPWGAALDPEHVLEEHPRPALARAGYTMLNGWWEYAVTPLESARGAEGASTGALAAAEALAAVSTAAPPAVFDGSILVPFSPEAPLSGVGRAIAADELLWYRRSFTVPALGAHERLILHFEAVDWVCAVYVDGALAATHQGGYLPFDVDATPCLHRGAGNAARAGAADGPGSPAPAELVLCVYDPNSAGVQPRGKQSLEPGGIWYTAQSGIWQSVWYEVVPAVHLTAAALSGDAAGTLSYAISFLGAAQTACLQLAVLDAEGGVCASVRHVLAAGGNGTASGGAVQGELLVENPRRWSPNDPCLYRVQLELSAQKEDGTQTVDRVESYCAFRSLGIARDAQGTPRFLLNGEPLFLKGVLDQGSWPDGLLTAPADAALVHDIRAMKDAGFNMLRKHIKVESARWYYHCDRLGMLVWQDAVSGGSPYSAWWTSRIPTLFSATWGALGDETPAERARLSSGDPDFQAEWNSTCDEMVELLRGHPCIVAWTLFNEGWGQFGATAAAERVHHLDPTRPIDAASGWFDQGSGDFLSIHNYFRPLDAPVDRARLTGYAAARGCRALVLSEFGGLAQPVSGHTFSANAYGYGSYGTLEEWRAAVRALLDEAEGLEDQGLAGYVYTQLSDVEDELNGLLTYDRRVNKLAG